MLVWWFIHLVLWWGRLDKMGFLSCPGLVILSGAPHQP